MVGLLLWSVVEPLITAVKHHRHTAACLRKSIKPSLNFSALLRKLKYYNSIKTTAPYSLEVFKLNIEKYFIILIGLFLKSNRLYIMLLVEAVSSEETREQLGARVNFMKNERAFLKVKYKKSV